VPFGGVVTDVSNGRVAFLFVVKRCEKFCVRRNSVSGLWVVKDGNEQGEKYFGARA
jgi:hypothetical protein